MTSLAAVLAAGSAPANSAAPGALGFIVIAAMGGALVLLFRSMSKHLRRVRAVRDAGLEPGSEIDADDSGNRPGPAARGPAGPAGATSTTGGATSRPAGAMSGGKPGGSSGSTTATAGDHAVPDGDR